MGTNAGRAGFGRIRVACGIALAAATCGMTEARALDAEEVVAKLQTWLDGTRDLVCDFRQTLASGALGTGLAESGRVYLRRPGRMRWDYLDPERKVALIDGDVTRLYLAEDGQLWEGRLADDALLATLLAGGRPVAEVFEAVVVASPRRGGQGAYRLQLVPRAADESFTEVVLGLRPPDFAITEAEVLDAAGNRMLYRFDAIERNRGLGDDAFYFEPPPGTEIVRP